MDGIQCDKYEQVLFLFTDNEQIYEIHELHGRTVVGYDDALVPSV